MLNSKIKLITAKTISYSTSVGYFYTYCVANSKVKVLKLYFTVTWILFSRSHSQKIFVAKNNI